MLTKSNAKDFVRAIRSLRSVEKSRHGAEIVGKPDISWAGLLSCYMRASRSAQIFFRNLDLVMKESARIEKVSQRNTKSLFIQHPSLNSMSAGILFQSLPPYPELCREDPSCWRCRVWTYTQDPILTLPRLKSHSKEAHAREML